jgi:hypothetical protein
MGKREREKGRRGEQELARIFRSRLPRLAERIKRGWQTRLGSDDPDVNGLPWWVECKVGKAPNILAALRQADKASDGRPSVACTKKDYGEWLVTLRLSDWLDMIAPALNLGDDLGQEP